MSERRVAGRPPAAKAQKVRAVGAEIRRRRAAPGDCATSHNHSSFVKGPHGADRPGGPDAAGGGRFEEVGAGEPVALPARGQAAPHAVAGGDLAGRAESGRVAPAPIAPAEPVTEVPLLREEVLSELAALTDAQLAVAYALVMHYEQDDQEIVLAVQVGAAAFRKHRTAAFNACEVDTRYELKKDCQREIAAAYVRRFATADLPPPTIGRRRPRRRGGRGE